MAGTAAALLLFVAGTSPRPSGAQQLELVEIRDLIPHETRTVGFHLDRAQDVEIRATGADEERSFRIAGINISVSDWDNDYDAWRGNAWILDARTREVVWELQDADTDEGRRGLQTFEGRVRLPAGSYEAHFASYSSDNTRYSQRNGRTIVRYDDDGLSEDFELIIRGEGRGLGAADLKALRDAYRANAFLSVEATDREQRERGGFELTRPTEVEIYALGEVQADNSFDYVRVVDVTNGDIVWALDDDTDNAGGAAKNRVLRERRRLPAGRYGVVYVTDDSHGPGDWNAPPPHDPAFWGVTLRTTNAAERANVRTFEYDPAPAANAIVALTRMGDDDNRSAGFSLTQPLDVRIFAIGEGRGRDMADYGYIMNARTRERVWEMTYDNTHHAGGAAKNRAADTTVRLPAGDYLVEWLADGSHSFEDWNSGAPIDAEYWGITVLPADPNVDRGVIREFNEEEDANVLTQLVRMRDDENARSRLVLSEDTDVRIYALGEGNDGNMYDYAWIEDAETGRAVWEMTYRTTDHAGGSRKNRLFDGIVRLRAGTYVVHYESDGSHNYDDWNSDAPRDPRMWGVTLYRVR